MSQHAFDTLKEILEGSYFLGAILLITLMFGLIKFHAELDTLALIVMFFVLGFATFIAIVLFSKAVELRVESQAAYNTFQIFDLRPSRMDVRNWKSCRPIKVKMGTFGYIETKDFLLIFFGPVVLDTLLSSLLTF